MSIIKINAKANKLNQYSKLMNKCGVHFIGRQMMTSLPEPVPELEIMEMFTFADKDKDGKISWEEFLVKPSCVNCKDCVLFCLGDD